MYGYQLDPTFIEYKLINLEERLRRNNSRVDGIRERTNETWDTAKSN